MILSLNAQTVLIDASGDGGFSNGPTFTDNGWTVANGSLTNKWHIGTAPASFPNSSAFISDNNGVTHAYTNNSISVVHFYRDVTFPTGETAIKLVFDWQGLGESTFWDGVIVSLAPISYIPTASSVSLGLNVLNAPAIEIGRAWNSATVQSKTIIIPSSLAGNCAGPNTLRLIFTWKNDGSIGTNPSAAIDNISLTSATSFSPTIGTFTIDNTLPTSGNNFNSFTSAINWLNSAYVCGINNALVFNVTAGQVFDELPPVVTASGTALNTITFQKSGLGDNPVIRGLTGVGVTDAGISLMGGDYFTFDGIDVKDHSSNINNTTQMEYGYLLRNASATDGSSNNIIKNCSVSLNITRNVAIGILVSSSTTGGGFTPTSASGANNNNLIDSVYIENCGLGGILITSGAAAFPGLSNIVQKSLIGASYSGTPNGSIGTGAIDAYGIQFLNQNNATISNNTVRNLTSTGLKRGIFVNAGQGVSHVNNNKVYGIRNTSTTSTNMQRGMDLSLSTTGTHNLKIYNNFISDISSAYTGAATATRILTGMLVGTGDATSTYDINFNSISINGSQSLTASNVCFALGGSTTTNNVRSNIFANYTNAQAGIAKHYCIYSTATAAMGSSTSVVDNNDYYIANPTNGFTALTNASDRATISDWDMAITTPATAIDANSISSNPEFINNENDLHTLSLNLFGLASMSGITWISTDIDGEARNMSTPNIGADEYILSSCSTADGGTITPGTYNICDGQTRALSSMGATAEIGISYQWKVSSTQGGPYSNALGGSGETTTNFTSGILTTGTYYFVMETTCSNGPLTDLSNEAVVTVNPLPIITVTPTTSTFCLQGTPISLEASGASTYIWSPANGLSTTTGNSVNASPIASTQYTVTGLSVNGCSSSANAIVTTAITPSITSVTASPSDICPGDNSQLQVNIADFSFQIGTGTITNSSTTYPAPYGNFWYGARHQMLILASELTASGLVAGPIKSMALNVTNLNGGAPLANYSIKMGNSAISAMTGWETVGTTVYSSLAYSPVLGLNTHVFSTPFVWDGVSNVIVETCFNNTNYSSNASVSQSTTPFVSTIHYRADASNICSSSSSTGTFSQRPNLFFTQKAGVDFTWSPATFLSATDLDDPLAENVTVATTYTVTADNSGCTANETVSINISTLSLSVSISPDNTVCEGTNVTLNSIPVGGGSPYSFAWTGPNGFTSTDQNPVLNSVAMSSAGVYSLTLTDNCTTVITDQVTLTINPSSVTVTPSAVTYCTGGSAVQLNATGADTYTWSPSTGLSSTSGDIVQASPSGSTYYIVSGLALNGCIAVDTVLVSVSNPPEITSVTASPSDICPGGNSQLQVNISETFKIGTGVLTNSTTTYPAPYGNYWYGARHQMLILASELTASGMVAGPIKSMALLVTNPNAGAPLTNYEIKMGHTSLTAMTSWATLGTTVYNSPSYIPVMGLNTHVFSTQFVWDGTSNIIVETCFNNTAYIENASVTQSATPFVSTLHFRADAPGVCSNIAITGTFSQRPNIVFAQTPNVNLNWSPATFLSATNIANPLAENVTAATTYTVTAEYSSCTSAETITLNVDPLTLSVNISPNDTVCEGTTVALISTALGGGLPYTYAWTGPNGFVSNDQNPILNMVTMAQAGVYTLTLTDNCSSVVIDQVTLTINPIAVTVTPSSVTYCIPGSPVEIIASGADSYTWSPAQGLSATTGDVVEASPSVTSTYVVTGLGLNGCTSTDTVLVNVSNSPVITSITSTPAIICEGDSAQIVAILPSATYCFPTVAFTGATGDYIDNVSFAGITNNFSGDAANSYTYYSSLTANAIANGTTQYPISISPGGAFGQQFRVWIDFNQNGVFEAAESVFNTTTTFTAPNSATGSITIPTTALNGITRMRVACQYSSAVGVTASCSNTGYGEFEDYNLSITGGVSSTIQYAWTPTNTLSSSTIANPIAYPAVSEMYSLIITDGNGCTATNNVSIDVNTSPVVNLGADVIACGTEILDAGNTSMDFEWNDLTTNQTLTASTSGIYSVTVTNPNTGCSSSDTIDVIVNPIPVVYLGADIIQCGGTILIDAENPGMDYEWNDLTTNQTLTVSLSGSYSVTVTDPATECSNADTVEVMINPNPVINLGSDITQCGGTVLLDAENPGMGYVWNDLTTDQTLLVTTNGTYSVMVTEPNTGCASNASIEVTIDDLPTVSFDAFTSPVCDNGTSFALTGGSPSGGVYSGPGVSGGMFDPTAVGGGTYGITYTVTGSNLCSNSVTEQIIVDICTDIKESTKAAFVIYPNPTIGMFNIAISNATFEQLLISIVDLNGKQVYNAIDKNTPNHYIKQINLNNLARGVYFLKLNTGDELTIHKLVLQ
ncbi:MAG: T9SS type A sorting domain-containing protein [Bacteroidetes bacterium]|nr:T9SS type A sorting domain-containing protein [Bacteroidota bacterium]HET6245976.1 GEVED domain-containing protein [Bacteroidia bacterium]